MSSREPERPPSRLVRLPPAAAQRLPIHPFATVFPAMSGEELEALGRDLGAHGQRQAVTLLAGQILDGRSRRDAAVKMGLDLIVSELPASIAPLPFTISANLARRHLTDVQRSMAAAKFADLRREQRRNYPAPPGTSVEGLTREEAAQAFRVSIGAVDMARRVLACCSPETVAKVEAGKLSMTAAAAPHAGRRKGATKGSSAWKDQEAGRAARRLMEALDGAAALTVLDLVQVAGVKRVKAAVFALSAPSAEAARFAAPAVAPAVASRVAKAAATRAERKRHGVPLTVVARASVESGVAA